MAEAWLCFERTLPFVVSTRRQVRQQHKRLTLLPLLHAQQLPALVALL